MTTRRTTFSRPIPILLNILITVTALVVLLLSAGSASAVSADIVISQVYGGGGNSGATLTNDFIELFNRGSSPVDLTGWSVQYASAAGTSWQVTALGGVMLQPGQYYLVQEAAGAGGTTALPTPDAIGSIAMSGTNGKVAVVNTTTALSGATPSDASIVDVVGYGSANFFEGSAAAPGLSNTTAALRASGGCTDTDDNSSDFSAGAPNPRNTASPLNPCGGGGPTPTPTATPPPTAGELVINEIDYDQPSTDAAEFVEIKNVSSSEVNLDNVTLELVNGNGGGAAIYQTIDLPNVTLAASDYYVVCGDATNVPNCDLDVSPDTNLIQNGAPDAVGLRVDSVLVDAVSYEGNTGAPYTEGSGTGLEDAPDPDMGISRCPDGNDTNANNADFIFRGITPGETNNCPVPPPPLGACGDPATLIHDVQGNGSASPLVGDLVIIEGVVVSNFQGPNQIGGYHVQEQDTDADADPLTSEGIHVLDNTNTPGIGDVVRVQGTVAENFGLTRLQNITNFATCGSGGVATAATVSLPVNSVDDFEAFEGMRVTIPQTMYLSEFFNFDRFGEIVLTTDRQFQPTAIYEPGSTDGANLALANSLSRITLDDGRGNQNPDPAIHPNGSVFDLSNLFRGGDTVANVTGVMDYAFGLYRIQPTQGAVYTVNNPRPAQPDNVGGSLKVASFNVLNYFTTLDDGVNDICGPLANQECRGADDANELARQRAKIIAAIAEINADVVGLIEIENNVTDGPTADLVSGLNAVPGAGPYDYIATGAIGGDAIRLALIYKPARVTPVGPYAILDTSVDSRFLDTKNRPVLAQTFEEHATGAIFTMAVNHLKSKGSDCNDVGDPDTGGGSGNCNLTRTAAAEALVDWLATDPTGSGDADFLIMGDLNSYDKEDPIDAIHKGSDDTLGTGDDYDDLVFDFQGEFAYSYLFDGQLGYLDHALGHQALVPQVTGVTIWHINADEPDLIDYDTSFKQPAQDAIYAPDAYRSSDHDPVIVGLSLIPQCNGQNATVYVGPDGKIVGGELNGQTFGGILKGSDEDDIIVGTGGDDTIDGRQGNDLICGGSGNDNLDGGVGNDTINGDDGDDVIEGKVGPDTLNGGRGNDTIRGGSGDDLLNGGDGNDNLKGENGNDILNGGAGNDTLIGLLGNDTLNGDAGDDTLNGDAGDDTLDGGSGDNDNCDGGSGTDTATMCELVLNVP